MIRIGYNSASHAGNRGSSPRGTTISCSTTHIITSLFSNHPSIRSNPVSNSQLQKGRPDKRIFVNEIVETIGQNDDT